MVTHYEISSCSFSLLSLYGSMDGEKNKIKRSMKKKNFPLRALHKKHGELLKKSHGGKKEQKYTEINTQRTQMLLTHFMLGLAIKFRDKLLSIKKEHFKDSLLFFPLFTRLLLLL